MSEVNLIITKKYYILCDSIKDVKAWVLFCESMGYIRKPDRSTICKNHKFKYLLLYKGRIWWQGKEAILQLEDAEQIFIPLCYFKDTNKEMCYKELIPYLRDSFFWNNKEVMEILSKYIKN
jgi:hypothetical protein